MANTFTSLHYHIVFSTKSRQRWLAPDIAEDLWSYIGGICRAHQCKALQIGGVEDHVHLLIGMTPTLALSDLVKRIKGESSRWLSSERQGMAEFSCQDGYGAFTLGKSQVRKTVQYILNQAKHHRRESFEAEFKKFLFVHEIEAEERYMFG